MPDIALPDADAADLDAHAPLLARFLADLGDTLDQLTTAGLAHPDPDLHDELEALADRARRLTLTTADAALTALAAAIAAIRAAAPPGQIAPPPLTHAAADATQRLVAWRRLYTRALTLQRVEAHLAAEALITRGERPPRPSEPTASLRAWPIGLALNGDRLTLHALDLSTGGRVTIHDRVTDLDPRDPHGRPAISRLFQSAWPLTRVLTALIDFDDHPVGRAHGGPLFGPAFRAVPRLAPLAPGLRPPPLPDATPQDLDRLRRVVQLTLTLERRPDGLAFTHHGAPLDLEASDTLTLNAHKHLARAGASRAPLTVILAPTAAEPRVIAALDHDDDLDHQGRIYPATDPTAIRLTPAALSRRLLAAAPDPFTRALAALHGGADRRALDAALAALRAPGLDAAHDAALIHPLTATETEPDPDIAALIDHTLHLGALPPRDITPTDLEPLLARAPTRADTLTPAHLYRALALAPHHGGLEPRRPLLLTLFAARYAGELPDLDPYDIATRALLLAELSREAAEADEAHGEDPLPEADILAPAREYLAAHLEDLHRDAPLPPLMALHALATTRAALHPPAPGPLLAPLMAWPQPSRKTPPGIAPHRLAHAIADALCDLDHRPRRAAEALLLAHAAGISHWFVG
ncbi:MAG: hypothetical protein H6705_00285 [Myxococcales bacterium]|nr:hypothetical protein [Myxococcales bacterium]